MKWVRYLLAVVLAFSFAPHACSQSERITVEPEQTLVVRYPHVTAVFARDSSVARVSLESDSVSVRGVEPGETKIVVFIGYHRIEEVWVRCIAVTRQTGEQQPPINQPRTTPNNASPSVLPGELLAEKLHSIPGNAVATSEALEFDATSDKAPVPNISQEPHADAISIADEHRGDESETNAAETPLVTSAEKSLSLRESSQLLLPATGMSAAYSLEPLIAEAQITDGQLHIWGRAPGQAVIVLVSPDFTTSSAQVTVTRAPPILPYRAWSGLNSEANNSRGFYEVRLSSHPTQLSDVFEYRASRVQLHITNAIVPDRNLPGVSTVWFPNTYLRIRGDRWRLTLLDENVESSPLSVCSTFLRGIHFSTGDLMFHAGYTSAAGFQSLFLPVQKQFISGVTFAHHYAPNLEIGVASYFIQRDGAAIDRQVAQGLGTLFFRLHTRQGYDLWAEAGFSKGVGGALALAHDTSSTQLHIDAHYRPKQYAASDTDTLKGLQSSLLWNRVWSERFLSTVSGSANHIFTQVGSQTIEVGTENLVYRLSGGVSLSAGSSVSHFSQSQALFPGVRRFAVPVTLSYDRRRFGVTAQYEFSRTSNAFSWGQGYGGSIRWNGQHFHLSANAGLDTQALGIDSVFSAFPALDVELARLGLSASIDTQQLAALLNNRAFLNSLGLAPNATLQLVPRNWQAGLNLGWQWARQVLELNSNYNVNEFLTQRNATFLQTARYRRGLTNSTEFIASFTLLESIAPVRRWDPIWEVGLRHQFDKSPFPSWRRHNGAISGTVSIQDSSGRRPLRGAEITLDSDRRATSSADGRYQFSDLQEGIHTVEIVFHSSRPFWYSTPSRVDTTVDSKVDFGVVYPSAEIIGYVLDDAGSGLAGISLEVRSPKGELNLTTDQAGKFVAPLTGTGDYVVRLNAETVPDGYALENLEPVSVLVGEGEAKKVSFALLAIRTLTGSVQTYDHGKETYVPLVGVSVQLPELDRTMITDSEGRYLFRNLPSGAFTIRVNGHECDRVQMSAAPQLLRHDIRVKPVVSANMSDSNSSP